MKILLDECVTKRLKIYIEEFEVFTVRELELSGIKNGKLMAYCVENKFDILLTIDKNLIHQQNLDKYPVTIVVLNCFTSKIAGPKKSLFSQPCNKYNYKYNT